MNIKDFCDKLFLEGKKLEFEDMEIYYINSDSFEIKVYQGEIDSYNVNTSIGLSFRGLIDGKMGYSFTEKFEEEDISYLLESARKNIEEVENKGEEFIFEGSKSYTSSLKSKYKEIDSERKINDAINLEKLGLSIDKRIDSAQHCMLKTSRGSRKIINTKGLNLEDTVGGCMAYLSLVASDGDSVKSGYSYEILESYDEIDFNKIATEATKDVIEKFGAKSVKTGKYKVILRNNVVADMLETFAPVFSADSVQKGISLLKDKIGEQIASDIVNLVDNPFLEESSTKLTFDDEGVATKEKILIENGVLKTYLYNLKTARKDGRLSTGNGFKPSYKTPVNICPTSFYIEKGERSFNDIVKDLDEGLIITQFQGLHSGASPVSGDFSLAAIGKYIKDGKELNAVEQITVSGNFYELLNNIEEVASDFKLSSPTGSGGFGGPSIVVKELNISGN